MSNTTLVPYHITTYYETVFKICVRRYGSSANDVVIFVMNANPGLEKYDILLPEGIKILLPDLPATVPTTTVKAQTFLWS